MIEDSAREAIRAKWSKKWNSRNLQSSRANKNRGKTVKMKTGDGPFRI